MESSTGSELKAMLAKEIAAARAEVNAADDTNRSTAVHRARRALKRAKSLFRVLKPVAPAVHDERQAPVKEAFKLLSAARDADAMLATVEHLSKRAKPSSVEVLAVTAASLADLARQAHDADLPIGRVAELLRAAEAGIAGLPEDFDAGALVAGELAVAYKRGRAAFRAAEAKADPDAWHAWRKAVKHRLHLTGLRADPDKSKTLADLDRLAEVLGEHNDLANLAEAIARKPELAGDEETAHRVLAVFSKRQRRLRKRARALGEELYRQRPRAFADRLAAGDAHEVLA